MFLLMAEFVIISGIADGIFRAAAAWVGRAPGGLAIAAALAGAGFGAISGSSTAAAATLSATSVPAMLREGYEPRLSYGVVAISGTLAMLIPPSVAMVLYGLIADVSIGAMFVGGVIPGILVAGTIIATVLILVRLDPSRAPRIQHYSLGQRFAALRVAGPMVFLFMGVTGMIYSGVATPTEASALGALGAFAIALVMGRITGAGMMNAAYQAGKTTCMVLLVVMAARVIGISTTISAPVSSGIGVPHWYATTTSPVYELVMILYFSKNQRGTDLGCFFAYTAPSISFFVSCLLRVFIRAPSSRAL